jgi:hypothetical protein
MFRHENGSSGRFRYVRPDYANTRQRRLAFRCRLLEGLEHAVQVAADSGHS